MPVSAVVDCPYSRGDALAKAKKKKKKKKKNAITSLPVHSTVLCSISFFKIYVLPQMIPKHIVPNFILPK